MAAFSENAETGEEPWYHGGDEELPVVWRPQVTRLHCDLDLRAIRCLIVLADERNFTRAATRLHMSQPGLSRAILSLEERIGAALVARGPRPVTLTKQGRLLALHGRRLLEQQQIAIEAVLASTVVRSPTRPGGSTAEH